ADVLVRVRAVAVEVDDEDVLAVRTDAQVDRVGDGRVDERHVIRRGGVQIQVPDAVRIAGPGDVVVGREDHPRPVVGEPPRGLDVGGRAGRGELRYAVVDQEQVIGACI